MSVSLDGNGAARSARWNPPLAALAGLTAAALAGLPFLKSAPNRLVSGEPVYLFASLHGWQWLFAVLPGALAAAAFFRPRRWLLGVAAAASAALIPGLLWLAGLHAAVLAQAQSPLARTSLGGAFWVAMVLAGLVAADMLRQLRASRSVRLLLAAVVGLTLVTLLGSGWCDELAIMKEFTNRSFDLWHMVLRHLQIVGLSLLLTLATGLPLGWAAHRYRRAAKALFPVLNIVQTIPSIALFGLLMAPLALLAANWPALGEAGLSGVGLLPGVLALVLYSLLPFARGMLAGLESVPSGVAQAAAGMGMTGRRLFLNVQLPLALPVLLAGVRTAAVQAIGLAAVTALIGAGGLGTVMFEGLYANAQDLVLLGVLPIVAMGVLADLAFSGLIAAARRPPSAEAAAA